MDPVKEKDLAVTTRPIKVSSRPSRRRALSPEETAQFIEQVDEFIGRRKKLIKGLASELVRWNALIGQAWRMMPVVNTALVRTRLDSLRTWHNQAWLYFHDLTARRKGIARGSQPFSDALEIQVRELNGYLLEELLDNALIISAIEAAVGRWHAAVDAASEAITLESEYQRSEIIKSQGKKQKGDIPFRHSPFVEAHLRWALATFMLEGNSPRLRKSLTRALETRPDSTEMAYLLARFEVMIGDYANAQRVLQNVERTSKEVQFLGFLVDGSKDVPGWLAHPCNVYTYRYNIFSEGEIKTLADDLYIRSQESDESSEDAQRVKMGLKVLACLSSWMTGNRHLEQQAYNEADQAYMDCQKNILEYFRIRYPDPFGARKLSADISPNLVEIAQELIRYQKSRWIWTAIRRRYGALTLDELYSLDWVREPDRMGFREDLERGEIAKGTLVDWLERLFDVDAFLLTMALVFLPLAMAETHRFRRDFDSALQMCRLVLRRHKELKILSEFIEKPFVKILMAQILLEKADKEFKFGILAGSPAQYADGTFIYQGFKAAETYIGVLQLFEDQGQYVNDVRDGIEELEKDLSLFIEKQLQTSSIGGKDHVSSFIPLSTRTRAEWNGFGEAIPIKNVSMNFNAASFEAPLVGSYASAVDFLSPEKIPTHKEANPIICALVLQASGQLMKLKSGFGYSDYHRDRAQQGRLTETLDQAYSSIHHASHIHHILAGTGRDIATKQQSQETLMKCVAAEQMSLRTTMARVERYRQKLSGILHSLSLHQFAMQNYHEYGNLDHVDTLSQKSDENEQGFIQSGFPEGAVVRFNKAIKGTMRQLEIAKVDFLMTLIDRAGAFLRRDYCVQFMLYQNSRVLSRELVQRLEHHLDEVRERYWRLALQDAYSAESAYNFEFSRSLIAVRSDYRSMISDHGSWDPDHLLAEFEVFKRDLILTEDLQQQASVVISLADDFPFAYRALIRSGSAFFTISHDLLECKLPGSGNLRVRSVEVAFESQDGESQANLMLSHLGISQIEVNDMYARILGERSRLHFTYPATEHYPKVNEMNSGGIFRGLGLCATWSIACLPTKSLVDTSAISNVVITYSIESQPIVPSIASTVPGWPS